MLSIVIPAYNEAKHIKKHVEQTLAYMQQLRIPHELIVVDDGSTDETAEIIKSFADVKLISYKENRGKGYAVRKGMLAAKGQHVLFMDADLATDLEAIPRALKEAKAHEVVIGSRRIAGAKLRQKQPFFREIIGKIFQLVLMIVGLRGFKDTQCGFKLFSHQAAKRVFSQGKIDRFAFDVEALYLAKKYKYSIKEIPVQWKDDPDSKVQPIVDGTRMFIDVVSIRALHSKLLIPQLLAKPLQWMAEKAHRFITYLFFSGIATMADFLVLLLLTELAGLHYLLSAAIGYLVGMVIHYALNKKHTFNNKSKQYTKQFGMHVGVALTGLLLHQALLYVFVELGGLWYVWAKIAATIIVLCWNFFGHSRLTFGLFK